jgi:hypothetical protein
VIEFDVTPPTRLRDKYFGAGAAGDKSEAGCRLDGDFTARR